MALPLRQLLVLGICRFAEPFALASLFPYVPSFLRHLGIAEQQIAAWTGILAAIFGLCESFCAIPLSRLSDKFGRKRVLLGSLCVQMLGNLALGFCSHIWQAVICLMTVGIGNGNVAVMRTLVAEMTTREQQAKAFSFLPTAAGIATIAGPAVGGFLSTVRISHAYPFVVPNALSAVLFLPGIVAGASMLHSSKAVHGYQQVANDDIELDEQKTVRTSKPGILELGLNCFIWLNALTGLHGTGFDHMLPVFLQLPVRDHQSDTLISFTSGLAKDARFTGVLMTIAGVCGILSAAIGYPMLAKKRSHLQILQLATLIFPAVYLSFPYTTRLTSILAVIICMLLILVKVSLSVMALQASMILLTNSVAADTVSAIHGVNFTIAGFCRGIGSLSSGMLLALGVKSGYLILPYWVMAMWAGVTVVLAFRYAKAV